ncbi:MAG: hypothetical protein LUQ20_07680, partial [Candidatus Methanoperedens sp.]|nr:hypothetical protein [Candidatus Methanoperedens sp.]
YSSRITNHSLRYNNSNPGCTVPQCHNTGWIHNFTLTKPSLTLPGSTFCLSCHGNNGTGGTNFSGMVTGVRSMHNNSVKCTQCHLNESRSIHPVRYLQQDGSSWDTSRTNAVNCTTCHQGTGLVNFTDSVKIPTPMNHSTNPYSGALWNGSLPGFWDNTSQRSSCEYCHGRIALHNISALGYINKVKGDNNLRQNLSTSTWCANCHYAGAAGYAGTSFSPEPPEILNISGNVPARARDSTSFYNHSRDVAKYNDSNCRNCHNNALEEGATSLNFSHNVAPGGGGPDCISCHDINVNKLRPEKRIIAASMRLGVHGNLNSNTANSTPIDPLNKACWACHLEGNEPVGEHYNIPARECDDNDCHSLEQSYRAPMVYSHFTDADLNSNPERALNYNISTSTSCYACHNNSLSTSYGTLNASVSHYANKENLIDTKNCIYCHLDKDNAEKWGNATEINKNRSAMIEMDREKNKFTAYAGEFMDLGLGYRLKVADISDKRGSALIELYKENTLLDSGLVNIGNYTYEETRIINNASSKIPIIVLNITEMFISDNESFIQFKGYRIKRVHSENRTTSCYRCHFQGGAQKHKYTVIDRVDDDIYYTEVFFNSSDRNEYDQQQALQILANKTPSDAYTDIERAKRKTLKAGEKWKLDENYSITLEDISTNSDSAMFLLEAGSKSFTDIVKKGEILEHELSINYLGYTSTNTTVFSARVSEILQPSLVVLEDIRAISPEINKVKDNTSVYGYNASWIWENDTFMTGPIPSSLHTPLLYDGKDGGAACLSCHSIGELGFHEDVNSAAASSVASANKACWACHGEGKEPKWHPANYMNPGTCKSCHVEQTGITYNATFIGDEKHGALVNCDRCHVEDSHRIIRFDVVPDIRKLSISKEKVQAGEKIDISATASAGYEMRLRGAEYYVDSPDKTIPMSALDGSFDDRVEDLTAELNTSGLETGNHSIYVRAMERNNKWGPVSSISISVGEEGAAGSGGTSARTLLLITGSTVISVLLVRFVLQHLASGKKPQ